MYELPKGYRPQGKLRRSVHKQGKRNPSYLIPMLLTEPMVEFWPFRQPQPSGGDRTAIPKAMRGTSLPAYTSSPAMRRCGKLLQRHTNVRAWIKNGVVCAAGWAITTLPRVSRGRTRALKDAHRHPQTRTKHPTQQAPLEVVPWDNIDARVHLHHGYLTAEDKAPGFFWDWATGSW